MNLFSKAEAFTHGFRLTLHNFWLWVKVAIAQLFITIFLSIPWFFVSLLILRSMHSNDPMGMTIKFADNVYSFSIAQLIAFILLLIAYFIVMFGFWVGYNKIILAVDKIGSGHVKTLFSGFGIMWPRLLIATFLYFILVVLGLIAFIIPGIIFMVRFYFINWLILDKKLGVIPAFKESWSLTRGHTWPLFIFVLCTMLLAAATKGWAIIFVMPLVLLASLYIYRKFER
jgi:uncharacterized membrane protein